MKKSILFAFALLGAMVASADSYLYWMVDNSGDSISKYDFAYAVLKSGTQELGTWDSPAYEGLGAAINSTDGRKTPAMWSENIAGLSSFFVELYNDSDELLGYSSPVSIPANSNFIKSSVTDMTITPYTFSTFTVPEPTSGLLMLLGVGLLGLKRKKA